MFSNSFSLVPKNSLLCPPDNETNIFNYVLFHRKTPDVNPGSAIEMARDQNKYRALLLVRPRAIFDGRACLQALYCFASR